MKYYTCVCVYTEILCRTETDLGLIIFLMNIKTRYRMNSMNNVCSLNIDRVRRCVYGHRIVLQGLQHRLKNLFFQLFVESTCSLCGMRVLVRPLDLNRKPSCVDDLKSGPSVWFGRFLNCASMGSVVPMWTFC